MRHYIIPIFVSHTGCPHTCVFCNQSRITMVDRKDALLMDGDAVRHTVESHLSTIRRNSKDSGEDYVAEISFFGGTFTAVPGPMRRSLLEAARVYLDAGDVHHIRCSTRPDYIDEEILGEVMYYGMDRIELGIQSMDDEVLRLSGRGHTAEDAERASMLIKASGISLGHQLMPGLPGDTPEKDIQSARRSIALKPDMVRIYPTIVIKDTPLEDMYLKGEFTPYTLEEAVEVSGQMMTMYQEKGISVIRCGLQATDEVSEGSSIVAGPWHPAFSELVRSRRAVANIEKYLKFLYPEFKGNIWVAVNPKDISLLYAGGKRYFRTVSDRLLCVDQDRNIERGKIEIRRGSNLPAIEICI